MNKKDKLVAGLAGLVLTLSIALPFVLPERKVKFPCGTNIRPMMYPLEIQSDTMYYDSLGRPTMLKDLDKDGRYDLKRVTDSSGVDAAYHIDIKRGYENKLRLYIVDSIE